MIGLGAAAREEAHALFSEIQDTYAKAASMGVERMHPSEMEDANSKMKLAYKIFANRDDNVVLSTVKSFHEELIPKLNAWINERETEYGPQYSSTELPPVPEQVTVFKTETGEVEIQVPRTPSFPGGKATVVGGKVVRPGGAAQPWYKAGGVDWRIIGGVAAGMLLLTWFVRRSRK